MSRAKQLVFGSAGGIAGTVYGTIVVMATVTAGSSGGQTDAWRLAVVVVVTVLVLWTAHVYAHGLAENADGPQHERRDGRHSRRGDRQLAPSNVTTFCPVKPPAALEALREAIGVDVGGPEDEHGHDDDDRKPPRVRFVAVGPGGDGRHHDDRSVDGPGDPAGGSEDQLLRSAHRRDSVLFSVD